MIESSPAPLPDDYAGYVDAHEYEPPVVTVRAGEVFPVEFRAARSWATVRTVATDGKPGRLIDPHPARSAVHISNVGPAVVYLGKTALAAEALGHALPVGASLTMHHREEIYAAVAAGGAPTTVTAAAEYLDGGV